MSKTLERLKGKERSTVDNIANCAVMADIARNVKGMEGVFEHYLAKHATSTQRRQWQALQDRIKEIRAELAQQHEEQRNESASNNGGDANDQI